MRPFALALLLTASPLAAAQTLDDAKPAASVQAVVQELFDAMRGADADRVAAVFHPDARLHSVMPDGETGGVRVVEGDLERFVAAVGGEHPVFDERVGEVEVRMGVGMATAWMGYRFYLGDEFSHCGVNAMQFVRTEGGWKILNLVDTRRTDCD